MLWNQRLHDFPNPLIPVSHLGNLSDAAAEPTKPFE
jgi:hypothetical protein